MSRPDWDPGWGVQIAAMFLPSRRAGLDGARALSTARFLWLAFALSLFSWLVVAVSIAPWTGGDQGWLVWVVVGFGLTLNLLLIPALLRRMTTLPAQASEPQLLEAFRRADFTGLVASELVVLVGVVAMFVDRSSWLVALAIPFALLGMIRVGPFQRTFEQCDRLLQEAGSPLRMTEAWRRAGSSTPPLPHDS